YHAILWIALVSVVATQAAHYQTPFTSRELAVVVLLEGALASAWFYQAKAKPSMTAYYLMQVSALAFFATLRRHLMLTLQPWNYEYDVWSSLAVSTALTGTRQCLENQPRTTRIPFLTTMCALPLVALVWVLVHGLGVNMALL